MADEDRNMACDVVQLHKNSNENIKNSNNNIDNIEQINEEEFKAINEQLDQLNLVLDSLESKNDNIHAELIKLLKSNRETRKQFQETQENKHQQEGEA
ncbi:PREDICTED: UPF0184 protein C9orf16 homolog isoform X2 [Ceratosolen solmsi marchali]|nr:PREDICTED: UPF0184 protein C9orf16 homolog isoform X2 [Ceratosolen solmsi marchali]